MLGFMLRQWIGEQKLAVQHCFTINDFLKCNYDFFLLRVYQCKLL